MKPCQRKRSGPSVLVVVSGGCVQAVYSDKPAQVRVVDWDGVDDDPPPPADWVEDCGQDDGEAWREATSAVKAELVRRGARHGCR